MEQPKDWEELERRVALREPLPDPLLCPRCQSPVEVQYALNTPRPAASIRCTGCKEEVRLCGLPPRA